MRSLIRKSLSSVGAIVLSFALAGNALAAGTHVKAKTRAAATPFRSTLDVAALPPYPNYTPEASPAAPRYRYAVAPEPSYSYPYRTPQYPAGGGVDVGQLIGALLGSVPAQYRGRAGAGGSYASSPESPTYDTPSPVDNGADQAAADAASAAAIEQANDTASLNASMAAAEQQNEAANAATIQTEINAGM